MIDERTEEQASLYALDLLDGEERIEFERTVVSDADVRSLVDQLRAAAAAAMVETAPERALPPDLESRIRAQLHTAGRTTISPFARASWLPWAIAAVLTIACSLLVNDRSRLRRQITALETRDQFAQTRIAMLSSQLADAPKAIGIVIWDAEKQRGVLKVSGVPANSEDRDYQLWVVDPRYKQPVSGGVFGVDRSGVTKISFHPETQVKNVQAFAISLERKGGVPKAEGPIVLAGQ